MITKVFSSEMRVAKSHCWYCIGLVELAVDMPK